MIQGLNSLGDCYMLPPFGDYVIIKKKTNLMLLNTFFRYNKDFNIWENKKEMLIDKINANFYNREDFLDDLAECLITFGIV